MTTKQQPHPKPKAIYIRLPPDMAELVSAEQDRFGISATDVARIALARMFELDNEDDADAA
jgi:hypothetical protein